MLHTHTVGAVVLGVVAGGAFLLWQAAPDPSDKLDLSCYPESKANVEQHIELAYTCLGQPRTSQTVHSYQSVIQAVDIGLARFGDHPELFIIKAQAMMNLHKFEQAYALAEAAIALNPNTHYYFGVLGDAALELGQYDTAQNAYQTMADIRPDFGVFARIAYFRELNGDIEGALLALDEADSAGARADDIAWLRSEQGRLLRPIDITRSTLAYEQALLLVPDYRVAQLGISRNLWSQGSTTEALAAMESLYESNVTITHAIVLGDMYFLTGDTDTAEQLYAVADASFITTELQGQNTDRDVTIFSASRGFSSDDVLARAARAYESQPNIPTQAAYARLLLQSGDTEAAWAIVEPLLVHEIGQHDPSVWLTAGLIAEAGGRDEDAQEYFTTSSELPAELNLRDEALASNKITI